MDLLLPILVAASVMPSDSVMWQMAEPAFENPVVKQWMLPRSHSHIGPEYRRLRSSQPVDLQEGTGEDYWGICADAYLKYKTSTLWGEASYRNGHQRDVTWNETSDKNLVYPYLTADSVGGDMSMERYRFAGGYADSNGTWAWGGSISYEAGLYYRNVDPRPRNVTGAIDVAAGVGRRIAGSYFGSVSLNYRKYKQTSDIDFKSQLGVEKIYHLTGLGTHYHRFAGTGAETYYNGNRIGLTANIYPASGRGLALTANLSRFTFNKVLTGLNKLPMAHVWHNAMTLQAAYMAPGTTHDWSVAANFDVYRRHGQENVFGDASSNVYPQIAILDMYADNSWCPSVTALWQFHPGTDGMLFWLKGSGRYRHRAEAYSSPRRRMETNHAEGAVDALLTLPFAGSWRATISAGATVAKPVDCSLSLAEWESQEPQGVIGIEKYRYHFLSHTRRDYRVGASVRKRLSRQIGLGAEVKWQRSAYVSSVHADDLTASISVYF